MALPFRSFAAFLSVWAATFGLTVPGSAAETPAEAPSDAKPTAAGIEFFENKIRPVLVAQCYSCHSGEAKEMKGGLALDTRAGIRKGGDSGPAVVPGDVQASLLISSIRREGFEMPPEEILGKEVVADFVKWVEMGAPDPREGNVVTRQIDLVAGRQHWAFQPIVAHATPTVRSTAWPKSDFDRYVLAALEAQGLQPVADADPVTLLRRVSLDLTGLQPTPEEIDAFLADHSPAAYERVVDRLLASQQFGERWGRHWLDVARFAESTGKERNIPYPTAWRYRDYVIDSLNADKPYDRFILEQIAGDLLPAETVEERNTNRIATGFLAIGPKGINGRDQELFLLDTADDQIDVVGRAILATTISCARCHDHKFDPIPQTDYYALAGIFRSTDTMAGVKIRTNNYVVERMLPLEPTGSAAKGEETIEVATAQAAPPAAIRPAERKSLQAKLAAINEQLSDLREQRKKAKDAPQKVAEIQAEVRKLNAERTQLQSALAGGAAPAPQNPKQAGQNNNASQAIDFSVLAIGVREGSPTDVALRIRGEVDEKGPVVSRGFLSVLKSPTMPTIDPAHSGRLELAQWLTQKDNPLTARVLANRIWFHLFGTGIVETVDNFGALGKTPSNPELLDALAQYVMDHNWSLKQTIRAVVLSRAYQMSSEHQDAAYAVDPSNQWLWRMNRRRLDAEVIRDTVMSASGRLNLERPIPIIDPSENGEIGRTVPRRQRQISDTRRSIYLQARRGLTHEMLALFDAADSNLVVGQRDVTTVATQALFMLNSPFILENSDILANRVLAATDLDDAARAELVYRLILARPATEGERNQAVAFVRDFDPSQPNARAAWSALAQVLFSSAEFRYSY